MSRALLHIVIVGLCLLGIAGCGNSGYDRRLAEADSLMAVSPDSARAVLRAIDAGRLSRADRAYHALLSTQAAYKCFDSIPSTATIDRAVDYFSSGSDREKLTRSLIYKGAVIEDLGNKTEAMRLYKLAEAEADTSDYFNLGYVNLRMAELYQEAYSSGREYIDKYRQALCCFEKDKNMRYQLKSLSELGAVYLHTRRDSAYYYINKAISISKELNDSTSLFLNLERLSRAYWADSLYDMQKGTALYSIKNGKHFITNDSYYDIVRAYSKLGLVDSAEYYLNLSGKINTKSDRYISFLITMRELSVAKGDYKAAYKYAREDEKKSDSIRIATGCSKISKAETEFIQKNAELKKQIAELHSSVTIIVSVSLIIIIIMIACVFKIKYKNNMLSMQMFINNLKEDYAEMERAFIKNRDELTKSRKDIEQSDYTSKSLTEAFEAQLNKMMQLMKLTDNVGVMKPDIFRRKFNNILFSKVADKEFNQLMHYVDIQHNGAVSRLQHDYPNLRETDIKIITFMYLKYPNSYISFFMGYSNKQSVNNRKLIIAKKLGIDKSLQSFLEDY